jgi:hypothetical protein
VIPVATNREQADGAKDVLHRRNLKVHG